MCDFYVCLPWVILAPKGTPGSCETKWQTHICIGNIQGKCYIFGILYHLIYANCDIICAAFEERITCKKEISSKRPIKKAKYYPAKINPELVG